MRWIKAFAVGWVCSFAIPFFGQGAAEKAAPITAVRCARMLDVKAGKYVPNAVVLIQGGKIIDAGSGVAVPAGPPRARHSARRWSR